MAGIYVHIPFCKTHCTYCAFYSELLRSPQGSEPFIDALCSEIRSSVSGEARTLYIGGGTPSVLSLEQLQRITDAIGQPSFEEFTMEVNPDDIVKNGPAYARGLRRLGVNRISMGIQSFDNSVLHTMGRRHNAAQAIEAYRMLRQAGFSNISIDLIFGFRDNLDTELICSQLLEMGLPQHISCYQLGIEEGSGLDRMMQKGLYTMPCDEECERQYYAICKLLSDLGYNHYEISNWALPGYESKHNSSYWNHTPYIGLGPGAHSLFVSADGEYVRRWNSDNLQAYIQAAESGRWESVRGSETLSARQLEEERVFLGLRTAHGIDASLLPKGAEKLLVPALHEGYMRIAENRWFISDSIIVDIIN